MIKKLLLSSHLCTGEKMKILFLIVNAFVLVKTQNETGSILPSLNNTELATATDKSTTNISSSTSIISNTTINYPDAAINVTTQKEINSSSSSGNNTEKATTTILPSTSINLNSTTTNPDAAINVTTQKKINSSSSSGNNTENATTTIPPSTSINSNSTTTNPDAAINVTTEKEINSSSSSGNNTEKATTTIPPSTSINSNSTTTNPDAAINVTTQEIINSSSSSLGNSTDLGTSTILTEKEPSPSSSPANTTEPATTPTKPIIGVKPPRKPQKDFSPDSPPPIITEPSSTTPINSTSKASATTPTKPENWPHTQILAKKNVNLRDHSDKSVQIAAPEDGDFLSFIRQSSFWVDKSLLIPKIGGVWNDKSTVQVTKSVIFSTAPPKWGKTINLSMLKFYFELPTNSDGFPIPKEESASYRYFKEGKVVLEDGSVQELDGIPLISEKDSRNLANHPVVVIKGTNYTGDVDSFKVMIHEAFQRHEGLLKRLKLKLETAEVNSKDYNITSKQIQDFLTFYDWNNIKNESSDMKLQMSIEILSELLSQIYESPAVILYDDYDHYIYETFFNVDRRLDQSILANNFSTFFETFMSNTFKFNEFRTVALITGVIRGTFPSVFSSFENYHRSYVNTVNLFPFYGIFQPEFEQLVQKRGIDRALVDNATQWYGGYRTLGNLRTQMYSTHSVTRFISTLQVQNYWPKSRVIGRFLNELLKRPELRRDFQNFTRSLDEQNLSTGILYARFRKLFLEDYRQIRRVQLGLVEFESENPQNEYSHIRHRDLILSLMVSEGYAAVHENQTGSVFYDILSHVDIKMPNREIYDQLSYLVNPK